jgi:diaminohydroxyphosphoribosylaminopyrimidine deaminase/5-amino-6-(5-phosphoribosylamino)uracil reductase
MQQTKTNNKEYYIKRCIKLALKGSGKVSPNPLVGCVIVKNGNIIGEGYHRYFGGLHAEINAINAAKLKGFSLKNTELYVNLEPCNHFGKTPPCTEAIIKEKIGKVYIGCLDSNPMVSGKGVKRLIEAGVKVQVGILEKECREINKIFLKFMKTNLPYVTLKIAQSLDGKIALNDFTSKWITSEESRIQVKKLRQKYDAVLIGHNTAVKDNPSLLPYTLKKNIPCRVILSDKPGKLKWDLKLFSDEYKEKTIVLNTDDSKQGYIKVLKTLAGMGISSVLVEGGGYIFSKFYDYGLYDDVYFFIAPKIIGTGISSFQNFDIVNLQSKSNLKLVNLKSNGGDITAYYKKIK